MRLRFENVFAKFVDSGLMNGKLLFANDYESKRPHDTPMNSMCHFRIH